MGILKAKRYRKCVQNEDGSVDCVAYKPEKSGKKIPTATIKAVLTPDCSVAITDSDGDVEDIQDLEEYLGKNTRTKCNKNPGL